jgi:hypothetical protein
VNLDPGELLAELVRALETRPDLAARLRVVLALASGPAEPIYLRVPDWAERAGVSRRTAWTWVGAGLPTVGTGRTRRVDVKLADAWLRERASVDDAIEKRARADATRAAKRAVG